MTPYAITTRFIRIVRCGIIAAACVFALAPLSYAQGIATAAQMKVPFPFQSTSGASFPPGTYTLRMQGPRLLSLHGASSQAMILVIPADNALPAKSGSATFHRYGNRYFLQQIEIEGSSLRLQIATSKDEQQLQRAVAQSAGAQVQLALLHASSH